jgi:hypothetical protein
MLHQGADFRISKLVSLLTSDMPHVYSVEILLKKVPKLSERVTASDSSAG